MGDLIVETDAMVGRVVDFLKRFGLAENTILIFTSDNGPGWAMLYGPKVGQPTLAEAGHKSNAPFRGMKGDILEGGHREPFIVRWPGKVPPGSMCKEVVSLNSLMATCAELVGVPLPTDAGEDSFSILPLLLGNKTAAAPLFVAGGLYGYSARRGPWVYIEGIDPLKGKRSSIATLFNLDDDITEEHDVIAQHPDIAKQLKESLDQARASGRSRPK